MIDQKTATKRAYDLATEALFEHVYICSDCSMTGSRQCATGRRLFEAENVAWTAYMEARK